MDIADIRLEIIMEREDIKKRIDYLEKDKGCLPYSDVIELKKLKKRNLQLKDMLAGH